MEKKGTKARILMDFTSEHARCHAPLRYLDRTRGKGVREHMATRGGFDPKRSDQRWWPAISGTEHPRGNSRANGITTFQCANGHRHDLQPVLRTDGDRHSSIAHRANRNDGRAFTMLLMICLLRLAPVQHLTRSDHQGHHGQKRPSGDETMRDAEHARRK